MTVNKLRATVYLSILITHNATHLLANGVKFLSSEIGTDYFCKKTDQKKIPGKFQEVKNSSHTQNQATHTNQSTVSTLLEPLTAIFRELMCMGVNLQLTMLIGVLSNISASRFCLYLPQQPTFLSTYGGYGWIRGIE